MIRIKDIFPEVKDCYYLDSEQVVNIKTGNIMKQHICGRGYRRVSLPKDNNVTKTIFMHRLLLMVYRPVDNMENLTVNHINGDKLDNRLSNLEWATQKENINHAWKAQLSNSKHRQGKKSNFSKYTEQQAKEVVRLLLTNKYTDKEIAEMTNTSVRGLVCKIRRRETWCHLIPKDVKLGKTNRDKVAM